VDNAGAILRSYNTVENNPPYLMFGNSGFNGLYTLDSPTWGFYSETETYSSGFPEGNYNLHIKAKSLPGVDYGPYPANVTRNEAGNTLVDKVYYFKIGTAAGRVGVSEKLSDETNFATVAPNPVTRTLTTVIKGAKGQPVKLNLTDITGRVLLQRDVVPTTNDHREEVDVSGQATGVYLMQVVSPTKKASLKVVKIPND
jgi:hypothetical protein